MIKNILPYVFLLLAFWYFPDFYVLSKNASNYIYKESVARQTNKVEVKVVKQVPYLPQKYSVLSGSEKGLRVELISKTRRFSASAPVRDEEGTALLTDIPTDTYTLNIGKEINFDPDEIQDIQNRGESVFSTGEILNSSIRILTINGDQFIVPIIP